MRATGEKKEDEMVNKNKKIMEEQREAPDDSDKFSSLKLSKLLAINRHA